MVAFIAIPLPLIFPLPLLSAAGVVIWALARRGRGVPNGAAKSAWAYLFARLAAPPAAVMIFTIWAVITPFSRLAMIMPDPAGIVAMCVELVLMPFGVGGLIYVPFVLRPNWPARARVNYRVMAGYASAAIICVYAALFLFILFQ